MATVKALKRIDPFNAGERFGVDLPRAIELCSRGLANAVSEDIVLAMNARIVAEKAPEVEKVDQPRKRGRPSTRDK